MLVESDKLFELTAQFETAYCRIITVRKAVESNCNYIDDFDSNYYHNKHIETAHAWLALKHRNDEKLLFYKKVMNGSFRKQWQKVDDKKIKNLKIMSTYIKIRVADVSKNARIFNTRMIYKIKRDLIDVIQWYKIRCVIRDFE